MNRRLRASTADESAAAPGGTVAPGRRLACVAITTGGVHAVRRLHAAWPNVTCYVPRKLAADNDDVGTVYDEPARSLIGKLFQQVDGLILFLAVGAAVRLLAPHLRQKQTDPAVVTVDDACRFAVSLLSGHQGGANDLARVVAALLGAMPVITTASDAHHLPALDLLGHDDGWRIDASPETLKQAAAALVNGDRIAIYQDAGDTSWQNAIPADQRCVCASLDRVGADGIEPESTEPHAPGPWSAVRPKLPQKIKITGPRKGVSQDAPTTNQPGGEGVFSVGLEVSAEAQQVQSDGRPSIGAVLLVTDQDLGDLVATIPVPTVVYRPRTLVAGVGCSRGAPVDEIDALLKDACREGGVTPFALREVATIDLKADEKGISDLAARYDVPLRYFTAPDLDAVRAPNPSSVVKAAIGTTGVCEPAALLASGADELLVPKRKSSRATVALARKR